MKFPPQHGAWAFLIVPAVIVAFLGAGNWMGLIFFLTWVSGYPVSYFLGRALVARIRRGSWSSKARTELRYLLPWSLISGVGVVTLILYRPWILPYGILVVLLWSVSVSLSWAGRERGISNVLLLVVIASLAPLLMYQVAKDHPASQGLPNSIWIATLMSLLFFTGSVLHVKALIREAKNRKWHSGSILFHLIVLVSILILAKHRLLALPFALALVRTVVIKPGLRPGVIGIVEAIVALALVASTAIVLA